MSSVIEMGIQNNAYKRANTSVMSVLCVLLPVAIMHFFTASFEMQYLIVVKFNSSFTFQEMFTNCQ